VYLSQEVDRIYKAGGPKEVTLLEGGQEKMKLQIGAQRFTDNAAEQVRSTIAESQTHYIQCPIST
jgi:hypothetical protein